MDRETRDGKIKKTRDRLIVPSSDAYNIVKTVEKISFEFQFAHDLVLVAVVATSRFDPVQSPTNPDDPHQTGIEQGIDIVRGSSG